MFVSERDFAQAKDETWEPWLVFDGLLLFAGQLSHFRLSNLPLLFCNRCLTVSHESNEIMERTAIIESSLSGKAMHHAKISMDIVLYNT